MIRETYNKHGRRSLMILSLNVALLIEVGLILPLTTVHAAPVTTTISVYDEHGALTLAKVSIFDAGNGRQIANGMTDPGFWWWRVPIPTV
jgi:hypothetical protein